MKYLTNQVQSCVIKKIYYDKKRFYHKKCQLQKTKNLPESSTPGTHEQYTTFATKHDTYFICQSTKIITIVLWHKKWCQSTTVT